MNSSSSALYREYLQHRCLHLSPEDFSTAFDSALSQISTFDCAEPETAVELNDFGVMALIEADQADDLSMKELYFQTALEAFQSGARVGGYPLCNAHLAIMEKMVGDRSASGQSAYTGLIQSFLQSNPSAPHPPLGLIYLPRKTGIGAIETGEILHAVYQARNGLEQATLILAATLCDANLAFYTPNGLRTLHLLGHLTLQSSILKMRLGIASFYQNQLEGLHYLHQAHTLNPNNVAVLQTLFLACLDIGSRDVAERWLMHTQQMLMQTNSNSPEWYWVNQQSLESSFTYVPFDGLQLAVESSLNSIVTSVVLAQGDWFEDELTFWRHHLQPGMVVIDVGANVGIYTFSAAKQVGSTGKVFAVEPFSACVHRLQETRRVNQLDWVHICPGAASNRSGKARLGLDKASELNQIIADDANPSVQFEEVQCFTLDELVEKEQLTRLDWLKIDAEGHEIQVLEGSHSLLTQFRPNILYENIAGAIHKTNLPVAEFLIKNEYVLYTYQPYFDYLIPLGSLENLKGKLNIIAIHQSRVNDFSQR
ncbi:MAG: FkbM family methyltransferase [Synechococcales cyanobacterium T60_A2020_003]|nr:FkbM family methyltransferase [Synechococcales cyanobacterium T60_A2020_003]